MRTGALIYLDYNCFQRSFDDPHQVRIQMEALACQEIFILAEKERLNKALGPSAALRFLTILHREPTDYVQISKRLYKKQSLDDIFERAKKRWKR